MRRSTTSTWRGLRSQGRLSPWRLRTAVLVLAVVVTACGPSGQPQIDVGAAQASEPVAGSAQVVLDITNHGDAPDTVTGAQSDAAVDVEMHQTAVVDGRHTMGVIDSLEIPAGATVQFRPGRTHLMLVAPDESLTAGGTFELTLHLERTGDVTVPVEVVELLDLVGGDR